MACDDAPFPLAIDSDPNFSWQWTLSYSNWHRQYDAELRLYQTPASYELIFVSFSTPEPEQFDPSVPPQWPRQVASWHQRALEPTVASILSRAIIANQTSYADWLVKNGLATGAKTDADALALMGCLDCAHVSMRSLVGCAPNMADRNASWSLASWESSFLLLSMHTAWRLGPVNNLLEVAAIIALDTPTQPILNSESRRLFWQGAMWLYALLSLPTLIASLVLLLPGRPRRRLRFVWVSTLTVYGISALLLAVLSPFVFYALYFGGAKDYGGIQAAALAGGVALAGGGLSWVVLSLLTPLLLRIRGRPKDCFDH